MACLALATMTGAAAPPAGRAPECRVVGGLTRLADLPEASGITVSRTVPGRLWALADSGDPAVVALDERGAPVGRVAVPGARVEDWEAIAAGPCAAPGGACLYIADIGDNDRARDRITVYRVPEPPTDLAPPRASDAFHARYPDGPHDAESLLVAPDGRLFVVTKGSGDAVALYAFPRDLQAGGVVPLERVGRPRDAEPPKRDDRITDGAVSPDGAWAVLRTATRVHFYRAADLLAGRWAEAGRVDVQGLGEPQGEGIAFGPGNVLYLAGEGGRRSAPGTLARLVCT